MNVSPVIAAAFVALAVVSVACGARVSPDPTRDPTDEPATTDASGNSTADNADASDGSRGSCGGKTCGAEGCCGEGCCAVDAGVDTSTGPTGVCTAEMLASIKPFCGGVASGTYYTGLLDFACAGTTATAPDRDAQIGAFCKAHKVGDTVHAELTDAGDGFYCYCFVA